MHPFRLSLKRNKRSLFASSWKINDRVLDLMICRIFTFSPLYVAPRPVRPNFHVKWSRWKRGNMKIDENRLFHFVHSSTAQFYQLNEIPSLRQKFIFCSIVHHNHQNYSKNSIEKRLNSSCLSYIYDNSMKYKK